VPAAGTSSAAVSSAASGALSIAAPALVSAPAELDHIQDGRRFSAKALSSSPAF